MPSLKPDDARWLAGLELCRLGRSRVEQATPRRGAPRRADPRSSNWMVLATTRYVGGTDFDSNGRGRVRAKIYNN